MAQDFIFADIAVMRATEETTYGSTPVGGFFDHDAIQVRNFKVKPMISKVEKKRYGASFQSPGSHPGRRWVELEFEVPLPVMDAAPGANITPPEFHPLLESAGFVATLEKKAGGAFYDTITYRPTTLRNVAGVGYGEASCALQFFLFKDGAVPTAGPPPTGVEVWLVNGAVFNAEFNFSAEGEAFLKFTGKGLYTRPANATTSDIIPVFQGMDDGLVVQAGTITVGGATQNMSVINVNMNWTVKDRISMASGTSGFMITRMGSITGSFDLEARLEATDTRWAKVEAATSQFVKFHALTTKGLYVGFEVPNAQLESPDPKLDGTYQYAQPFSARDYTHGDEQVGLRISSFDQTDIAW